MMWQERWNPLAEHWPYWREVWERNPVLMTPRMDQLLAAMAVKATPTGERLPTVRSPLPQGVAVEGVESVWPIGEARIGGCCG